MSEHLGGELSLSLYQQAKRVYALQDSGFLTIPGRLFSASGPHNSEQPWQTFPCVIAEPHSAEFVSLADVLSSWLHKQATSTPFFFYLTKRMELSNIPVSLAE